MKCKYIAGALAIFLGGCSTGSESADGLSSVNEEIGVATATPLPVVTTTTSTTTTTTTSTTTVPPTTTTIPPTTVVTTQPPQTTVPPPPAGVSCGGYYEIIEVHFGSAAGQACRVMACETGHTFNPNAKNPRSTASGLFQFLDGTWVSTTGTPAPARAYPADVQIAAAAKLYHQSGWSPWVCKP